LLALTQTPELKATATEDDAAASPSMRFELASNGLPTMGIWKSAPLLTDLNADGKIDLVAQVRLAKTLGAWLGDGKLGWTDVSASLTIPRTITCGGGVAAGDINGDGHVDLAVADHCEGVAVFTGDGKGAWQLATKSLNPETSKRPEFEGEGENPFVGAEDLAMGDVNGDGKLDLVVGASDRGGFTVYFGDGSATTWTEHKETGLPTAEKPGEGLYDEGGWVRDLHLHDMNGDGHLDVVASYHAGLRVWHGDGKGMWTAASQGLPSPMLMGIGQQVAIGDVNKDGRPDLLQASTVQGVEVFLQQEDGSWKLGADPLPELRGGAMAVALGDFDGDGWLDIFAGGKRIKDIKVGYGLFVLRNDTRGGWTPIDAGLPDAGLEFVWGISTFDVDGDKRVDAIANMGNSVGKATSTKPGQTQQPETSYPRIQVLLNKAQ
jgi:hypothetical protein